MRTNLPVTKDEFAVSDDMLIVSKTDAKGKLTYFNQAFIDASGFAAEELTGQPHNIVRHPEMPEDAFADLWATLKAGKPWTGAVKNRRKDGGYYWVLASASPIWEGGQIAGYMSIHSALSAEQRAEAERIYPLLRSGKGHAYKLSGGLIRRRLLADRFHLFTSSLKARLMTLVGTLCALLIVVGLVGILATENISRQVKTIYEDRAVPLQQLFEISDRMNENTRLVLEAALAAKASGKAGTGVATRVEANISAIGGLWSSYMATYLTPEEKIVAQAFASRRADFVERGLKPALLLLAQQNHDAALAHMQERTAVLFAQSRTEMNKLVAIQVKEGKASFELAESVHIYALLAAALVLLLGCLGGALLGRNSIRAIGGPMRQLSEVMANIAQGHFNSRIRVERDDEIGIALRNLQALQAKLGYDRAEKLEMERRTAEQRSADMRRLAGEFESAVGEIIKTVASASVELEASAASLSRTAGATQQLSVAVASASQEAAGNVQSMASATEEMSSSVNEIGRQIEASTRIAANAVDQAAQTDRRISTLAQSASRIGDIVELITNIAAQTNLLALNATIEAARAGEAGRGFAVVASEVKALALQTAKATDEIGAQIASIQQATDASVADIKQISSTIDSMSEITATIAAAIEEQNAATAEIARNVQEAARGTAQASASIAEVNQAAAETGAASSQVLSAAQSLSQEGARLQNEVAQFLATVRAAS